MSTGVAAAPWLTYRDVTWGVNSLGATPKHGRPVGDQCMKISIEIDCTPEEARSFLGLPDVSQVQEAFVEALAENMKQAVSGMDGESLMKSSLPVGKAGWEQWQNM